MTASNDAEARLLARLPALRERALSLPYAIRVDKKTVVRGVIIDVEFGRWEYTGAAVRMVFKVTMECGAAKASRTFHCAALPV